MSDEEDEDGDNNECECPECGGSFDCGEVNTIVYVLNKDGSVKKHQGWCDDCYQNNSFYCNISGENYASSEFSEAQDEDGDNICAEYVKALGWKYNATKDAWTKPSIVLTTDGGYMAQALDFYWTLPKGKPERVCMLIYDDSEKAVDAVYAKKIHKRIEDANADAGDPNVLNVYTRLQLIDDKVLLPTYRL